MLLDSLHYDGPVNIKSAVIAVPEKERTYLDDVRDKIVAKGGDVRGFDEAKTTLRSGGILMPGAAAVLLLFPEKKHLLNLQEADAETVLNSIRENLESNDFRRAVTEARSFAAVYPQHRHLLPVERLLEAAQRECFAEANRGKLSFRDMLHGHMFLSSPSAPPEIVPFGVDDIMLRRVQSARDRKEYNELLFEAETAKIACPRILDREPLKAEELNAMEALLDKELNHEGMIGWTTSVFPISRALCVIRAEKVRIDDGVLRLQMMKKKSLHRLDMPELRRFADVLTH